MMLSRTVRRFAALAAAFGIALQALWPAIAQARPANSMSVPVCSVDGARHEIQLPLGRNQDDKGSQHCKLCVLGADKAVVASVLPFMAFHGQDEKFEAKQSQGHKPRNISFAHPRAPPQAS